MIHVDKSTDLESDGLSDLTKTCYETIYETDFVLQINRKNKQLKNYTSLSLCCSYIVLTDNRI